MFLERGVRVHGHDSLFPGSNSYGSTEGRTGGRDSDTRLEYFFRAGGVLDSAATAAGGPLIGVARGVTDFSWCCNLSELAVSASAQRLGVGKGLLDEARRQLGPQVALMLVSVPEAGGFYERAGMTKIAGAFWHKREH